MVVPVQMLRLAAVLVQMLQVVHAARVIHVVPVVVAMRLCAPLRQPHCVPDCAAPGLGALYDQQARLADAM